MNSANQHQAGGYDGEVVYIFAYDVAYDTSRQPVPQLLGCGGVQYRAMGDKRGPREPFFYRPQVFELPAVRRVGPNGPVDVRRTVKLFPVGAVSIAVRVPFRVERLEQLVDYHDIQFDTAPLLDEITALAEQIRLELQPHLIRPVPRLRYEEAYTVFCLHAAPLRPAGSEGVGMDDWLHKNRRLVAAILTQEPRTDTLSDQEAIESTGMYLSYYENDLTVVDWDAAMLIGDPGSFEETLHIAELANVQLAELEAYDRLLDESVDRAYRDLRTPGWRPRGDVVKELREIRIDLARLSDELSNITKFLGDWHLAREYQHLAARFHLADWSRVIDSKLKTVADLYSILRQDQVNRLMMILEVMIVLLFVIDLYILVVGLKM